MSSDVGEASLVAPGQPETVTHLAEVPRELEVLGARSDAELVVDVAVGIVSTTVGAGMRVVRATSGLPVLRSWALWHPPLVPARWQPAAVLDEVARRGARHRARAAHDVERWLDQWVPVIVETVVSRLDLTGIVTRHVDLDAVVEGVDVDAIADRLDIGAVIDRVDLVAVVEEVIAAIDLPAIIRDSTGSMASETVRGARMTGISADDAISRTLERHFLRRRRPRATDGPGADAP
jgi:hypothetical protein